MRTPWDEHFIANLPSIGGFYTSHLRTGPFGLTSAFLEAAWALEPRLIRDRQAYMMVPEPDADVLVIDSMDDVARVLTRYRYPTSGEIDYPAMLADGIAGVHLTERGARANPAMWYWTHESSLWLRWCFNAEPQELASTLVVSQEPERAVRPPYAFHGMAGHFRPWWFVTGPVDTLGNAELQWLHASVKELARDPQHLTRYRLQFYAGMATLIGSVHEHNFPDGRGGLLPTGPALVSALRAAPPIGPQGRAGFVQAVLLSWWLGGSSERLQRPVLPHPPVAVPTLAAIGAAA